MKAPADCDNTFSATQGIITSPGYPSEYQLYTTCYNYITAPSGSIITLMFTSFGLEYDPNCSLDWLKVTEKKNHLNIYYVSIITY